jgi:PTS system ascorbate-specific IIA component
MLKEFVENGHTVYHQRFDSWEEAIQAGCEPLLKDNTITQEYVNSVIQCVKDFGPYIVIAPMIAMPHSTQGAVGVNDTKISFMKVEEAVHFKDGDPEYDAKLFFTLASLDGDQHMQNIMKLSEMLMNDVIVEELLKAKNDDDLLRIHKTYLEDLKEH